VFLLLYYYFTQEFVSESCRKAYLAFLIIYLSVTHLPKIVLPLFSDVFYTLPQRSIKKYLGTLFVTLIGILQAEYLWIILFYNAYSLGSTYRDNLKDFT
jgi:hypothetical protein